MTDFLPDATLVARAQAEDRDAYAALVRRYQDVAFRTALIITRDASDAEDAVQTALTKAWLHLDRFRSDAPFRPWLLRIVANEAKNLRLATHRRIGRQVPEAVLDVVSSAEPEPLDIAATNETSAWLLGHLDRLRDDDRLVIAARYLLDLNEEEMANVLGCARGTVKSRLSRAMARLRSQIDMDASNGREVAR
ncbi:MAG: RNA polymerase sigma factor [Thermomicrobiales bacterium]